MLAAEMFDLTGEVALVTGASSGLGARFAETLSRHGAKVVMAARRGGRLADLRARLGPDTAALELDVADRGALDGAMDRAESFFGTVTLLVNNAGIAPGGGVLDAPDDVWERTMAVNLDAPWRIARAAARRMVKAGKPGAIINIASILSVRVAKGEAAYCVSKAAVAQLTAALAVELAKHRIRVNAIAPGYFLSEMTEGYLQSASGQASLKNIPMRRAGAPPELDGALLLLASPKAGSFMTGSTITVDGGHLTAFA